MHQLQGQGLQLAAIRSRRISAAVQLEQQACQLLLLTSGMALVIL